MDSREVPRREEDRMRRQLLAVALLAGAAAATAQQASTAGNALPAETTAVYRATSITGGTLVSLSYTHVGSTIAGVTPTIQGTGLLKSLTNPLPKTVVARLGSSTAPCTQTAGSVLGGLLGLERATYDCTGLTGRADRPPPLVITVS